ncbi:MAG: hypothetical protein CFE40_10500 [Burkholderiales bacterium PBB1]|nr:MAG: hypothetical protein CFE40_10500 [Burkholderiales bacterium PBB1]
MVSVPVYTAAEAARCPLQDHRHVGNNWFRCEECGADTARNPVSFRAFTRLEGVHLSHCPGACDRHRAAVRRTGPWQRRRDSGQKLNPYHLPMSLMLSIALWNLVTRLGEAQILLPAALLTASWFVWRDRSPRLAVVWMGGIAAATLVTTASKIAFMGYGLGWAALDFTGVSGHSMFAAAIYPLTGVAIASAVAGMQAPRWWRLGLAIGMLLALLVGLSRVAVEAHSWSEVVAGLLVGGAVPWWAARAERAPPARHSLWLPVVVCVWLGSALPNAPPSPTHGWVTQLALAISGRDQPYTRADLLAPRAAPTDGAH